jgi:hypothetical protein
VEDVHCAGMLPHFPRWQSLRLAAPPWAPGLLPYWRTHAHLHDNPLVNHKRIGWGHRDRDRGPAARQRQAARLGVKFAGNARGDGGLPLLVAAATCRLHGPIIASPRL